MLKAELQRTLASRILNIAHRRPGNTDCIVCHVTALVWDSQVTSQTSQYPEVVTVIQQGFRTLRGTKVVQCNSVRENTVDWIVRVRTLCPDTSASCLVQFECQWSAESAQRRDESNRIYISFRCVSIITVQTPQTVVIGLASVTKSTSGIEGELAELTSFEINWQVTYAHAPFTHDPLSQSRSLLHLCEPSTGHQ